MQHAFRGSLEREGVKQMDCQRGLQQCSSKQAASQYAGAQPMPLDRPLHDLHCHLDALTCGEAVAAHARSRKSLILACTVSPEGFAAARLRFEGFENVRVALGLHPWQVACDTDQARTQLESAELHMPQARFVGEVGLDFSARWNGSKDAQLQAFRRICAGACAPVCGRPRVLSIHAVHAAACALDILEETGAAHACTCIFHWFSGTNEDLARARRLGCLFSVNERMARSRRGREYIRQLSATQLLLETDAPTDQDKPRRAEDSSGEDEKRAQPKPAVDCEKGSCNATERPAARIADSKQSEAEGPNEGCAHPNSTHDELDRYTQALEATAYAVAQIKGAGALATIAQTSKAVLS